MQTVFVVSLIFALCYLFTLPVFSTRLSFLGFRFLFFSGAEFLLIGYLVGPRGLGLIPDPVIDALDPILHLALGWAGMIFGLQFNRKMVRVYPLWRYGMSFFQTLVTTGVVAAGAWLLLGRVFPDAPAIDLLLGGLMLGICAGSTAPSSIHYFSRVFRIRGRVNRLLKFIVAVDGIPAVLLLGVVACLSHVYAGGAEAELAGWKWLVIATGAGIVLGLLLTAMVELEFGRDELLLFVLGVVVLAGGLARYLHLSAVYVSFVLGVTVANSAWNREEVHKVAAYAEKPIYLSVLVMAGALLVLDDPRVYALALLLVVLRFAGKLVGNLPWRWLPHEPRAQSPLLGLALLSQGGLAVVLAIDFEYLYRAETAWSATAEVIASAVLLAVLVNEIFSPLFLRFLFPRTEMPAR